MLPQYIAIQFKTEGKATDFRGMNKFLGEERVKCQLHLSSNK